MRESFLQKPSFLQSVEWGKLQNSVGRKTWEIDGVLVIQHRLPFGLNYLYCPRPQTVSDTFFEKVQGVAAEERSIFLKVEPSCELRMPTNYEYQRSHSLQPRKTVVWDLRKTEEGLLAKMHEKTRYNIRLAEKHGVQVKNFQYEEFWHLLQETAERDKFDIHESSYYKKILETRSENFSNELFFAEYKGKVLAAVLINFYKPLAVATYLHGASTREHKEVMAPHLLHWSIIKEAKKRGLNYYDFWGIDEVKWPGVTRFKLGFGGDVVEYPPAVDIIYRPVWYRVYQLVKKLYKIYL